MMFLTTVRRNCKSTGQKRVPEEAVDCLSATFARSPQKSTRRTSRELNIPRLTVWKERLENDEFCDKIVFSHEAGFFLSGKVNRHN
ncbi:hypothetical protein C0J52_28167, partial [Blattella germanica]